MSPRFEVSDKVVLCPLYGRFAATVPRLVSNRVYCVEQVNYVYGNWWVRLVGVRENRVKCCDAREVSTLMLRRVGSAARKEEA